MLTKRFYIGHIPDGNGGWLRTRHEPFIEAGLLEDVQNMRLRHMWYNLAVTVIISIPDKPKHNRQ
jgi:hypothetical protein